MHKQNVRSSFIFFLLHLLLSSSSSFFFIVLTVRRNVNYYLDCAALCLIQEWNDSTSIWNSHQVGPAAFPTAEIYAKSFTAAILGMFSVTDLSRVLNECWSMNTEKQCCQSSVSTLAFDSDWKFSVWHLHEATIYSEIYRGCKECFLNVSSTLCLTLKNDWSVVSLKYHIFFFTVMEIRFKHPNMLRESSNFFNNTDLAFVR